ncbi:CMC1 isoform 5, partial [Pongo abelii]
EPGKEEGKGPGGALQRAGVSVAGSSRRSHVRPSPSPSPPLPFLRTPEPPSGYLLLGQPRWLSTPQTSISDMLKKMF